MVAFSGVGGPRGSPRLPKRRGAGGLSPTTSNHVVAEFSRYRIRREAVVPGSASEALPRRSVIDLVARAPRSPAGMHPYLPQHPHVHSGYQTRSFGLPEPGRGKPRAKARRRPGGPSPFSGERPPVPRLDPPSPGNLLLAAPLAARPAPHPLCHRRSRLLALRSAHGAPRPPLSGARDGLSSAIERRLLEAASEQCEQADHREDDDDDPENPADSEHGGHG